MPTLSPTPKRHHVVPTQLWTFTVNWSSLKRRRVIGITYLDRSKSLCIGVSTLHTRIHKFRPDIQKILLLSTEHVDALGTGDFAIKTVFLGYGSDSNELIGRYFTTWNSGDHRECAVSLNVGEEFVVCFLQVVDSLVHDVRIEQTGQNGCNRGLAQFATKRVWFLSDGFHDVDKGFQLFDGHNIV